MNVLKLAVSTINNLSEKNKDLLFILLLLFITSFYFFPMFRGLILLPLDLLISAHNPWYFQSAIYVKNPFLEDSITQMYPWKYIVFTALNNGVIPFWNPYTLMGTPFMASMKPMVFYPLVLLLFKFGPLHGWNLLLFLQVFLSLLFTYFFLRSFQLPRLISIFGSIVYACNSLMMAVLPFGSEGHVLLWFPLMFFAIKKFIDTKVWWTLPLFSFAIGSSILAGQFQYFIYHIAAVIGFASFYCFIKKVRISVYVFLFFALLFGVGISAIQLLPSIELLSYANRSAESSQQHFLESLLQPIYILRLFSPDFFGNPVTRDYTLNYIEGSGYFGIIPLFFVLYALLFVKKKKELWFFLGVAIIGIILSLEVIGKYLPLTHIQLLYFGAGYRVFSLIYLPAALLSSIGLFYFIQKDTIKHKKNSLALFSLLILLIFGMVFFFQGSVQQYSIKFENIVTQLILAGVFIFAASIYLFAGKAFIYSKYVFVIFVITLSFFDLFRMGYRFLTYTSPSLFYPTNTIVQDLQDKTRASLDRVYGLVDPEVGSIFKISTPEIYNPLYLERSRKTMDALIHDDTTSQKFISSYYLFQKDGGNLKNAMDVLGVKYLVVGIDENPSIKIFHTDAYEDLLDPTKRRIEKFDIATNIQAYPRFGVFYSAVSVPDGAKSLQMIRDNNIDLQSTLILETSHLQQMEKGTSSAKLEFYDYNTARFSVNTDKPGYFYLSDTYYPGWKAYVNEHEVSIVRANGNFRAIEIPKGKSQVTFTYLPTHFYLGLIITIVSLLLAVVLPIFIAVV